jgi:hypothetical protein
MPQSVFVIVFNAVTLSLASPTCNDDDERVHCPVIIITEH